MEDQNNLKISAAAFLVMSCGYLLKKRKEERNLLEKKKARLFKKKATNSGNLFNGNSAMTFKGFLLSKNKKLRKPRSCWVGSINKSRDESGTGLMTDLLKEPSGGSKNFCRMSHEDFEYLLSKISGDISKQDTHFRKAISAKDRLAVTLRFLATGASFKSLHSQFKISPQSISYCIPTVCKALIKALKDSIKVPTSAEEWRKIAQDYEKLWNFPHCVGSIGGKHVVIQSSNNCGVVDRNYRSCLSIVLMGLVDPNYCFIFADCGIQGRLLDGTDFKNTELFERIEKNLLNLPPDEPLKKDGRPLPYVFIGNDKLDLSNHILKPYPSIHEKSNQERTFNYHILRPCRIAENAFGILASVFRVLRKPMLLQAEKASLITLTCVVLHNFLMRSQTSSSKYCPPGSLDWEENGNFVPGSWHEDESMSSLLPLNMVPGMPNAESQEIRNEFAKYFMTDGHVVS